MIIGHATLLALLYEEVGHLLDGMVLCTGGVAGLRQKFLAALKALDLERAPYSLGCIRGGGATWHFALSQNIGAPQYRGRWESEKTLRHYVQQGLVAIALSGIKRETVA